MKPIRKTLAALALAFAAVCTAPGAAPAGAAEVPTTTSYGVWHWNVAGSSMHAGLTDTGMVTEAVGSIKAQDPDFVSFNEICRTQYEAIRDLLAAEPSPWTTATDYARFATTRKAGTGICQGESFGNALFSKNRLGTSRTYVLPPDYTAEEAAADPGVEDRSMLCAPLFDQPRMRFCTTHITGSNRRLPNPLTSPKINQQQLNAVRDILDGFATAGDAYLLAGDLNARPGYTRLDSLMKAHTELDGADPLHCPGYGEWTAVSTPPDDDPAACASNEGNVKLDFVLARTDRMDGTYTADSRAIPTTCRLDDAPNRPCSDHRVLIGSAHLTVTTESPTTPSGLH